MPRFRAFAGVICCALAVKAGAQTTVDHYVPSRPANLVWGMLSVDAAPVLTVKSGQTVRIDTLSHQGATQAEDPVALLARYGVPREQILQDVLDFRASWPGRPRQGTSYRSVAIEARRGRRSKCRPDLETRCPGADGTSAVADFRRTTLWLGPATPFL
jgi:hypothetical protein